MQLYTLLFFVLCSLFCNGSSDVDSYRGLRSFVDIHGDHDYDTRIVHPCANNELECIRCFFARNSDCIPHYGQVPDPFFINHIESPIPHANVTFIEDNARVNGLNDVEIKEFYFNKVTRKLVLQIMFKEIALTVPKATFIHHREGREPEELSDYFYIDNKHVSMTMVTPITKHGIEICKSHVHTTVDAKKASAKYGPGLVSEDPTLRASFHALLTSRLNISLKEGYVVKGPMYMRLFIEHKVCSFK